MTLSEIYGHAPEQRHALLSILAQRAKLRAARTGETIEAAVMALTDREPSASPSDRQPPADDREELVKRAKAHAEATGCDFLDALHAVTERDPLDAIVRCNQCA